MIPRQTLMIAAWLTLSMAPAAAAEAPAIGEARTLLEAGRLADAATMLQTHLLDAPDDDSARFALGGVQFLQATERLGQSLYRHGLEPDVFAMPLFRLPVPHNATPEPLTYEKARAIIQRFVDDLMVAEATLARVDDPSAQFPLAIGLVRFDLDGDGTATDRETLWEVYRAINNAPPAPPEDVAKFTIDFDGSDAPWLRGYGHLLM